MIPISFLSFMISTISVASATIWNLAMTHAHSLTQANAQFMHTFVNTSTFTQNFICTLMLHWMIPIYLLWPQAIKKKKKKTKQKQKQKNTKMSKFLHYGRNISNATRRTVGQIPVHLGSFIHQSVCSVTQNILKLHWT